jgi:glycosyltransferase involved in cell wall biosynthesis
LFTFSKPDKKYSVPVKSKIPIKLPFLGIYQNMMMPQHDYSDMDVLISNGYQFKTDKPLIVYDVNQMANDTSGVLGKKYEKGFWKAYATPYKLLRKFTKYNQNAHYFSCSEYSAQALHQKLAVKTDVIYPAYDDKCFEHEKVPQICVMGRISPEKNLETSIEIGNTLGDVTVIAGSVTKINEPYLKKLKDLSNSNIIFVPNPSRQQFLSIFAESKIYLSASKETFGITTIEAIRSGCIPIVPNNSAHPETVPFTSLRYETINEAKEKINRVMNNPGIAGTMKERLQEHANQFSMSEFTRKLNNAIDGVLS